MRPGWFLGLVSLAAIGLATPLAADDTPAGCDVPASLLETESSLPKVEAAVKAGQPLNILVIGSRSSTIGGSDANGMAYPARMQAALKDKLPQLAINVSVEIQVRKTAEEVATGLAKLIEGKTPTLVLWQTGTVDAMRSVDPDDPRRRSGSARCARRIDARSSLRSSASARAVARPDPCATRSERDE